MTLEEAKEILRGYGGLENNRISWYMGIGRGYVSYYPVKGSKVSIDGDFSDTELEAIITIMRQPK